MARIATATPVAYAEEELGVHRSYERAKAARETLRLIQANINNARDEKRKLDVDLEDIEQMILVSVVEDDPGASQAAISRKFKATFQEHDVARRVRDEIANIESRLRVLEADRSASEADIRIETSRMTELGGYLQYLAAAKLAQVEARSRDTDNTHATK